MEKVNHPKHYNEHPSGVECIDIAEGFNFNLGSAIKYIWRAGLKPGEDTLDELRKAVWYINREIERLSPKPTFDPPPGWTKESFIEAFGRNFLVRSDLQVTRCQGDEDGK